MNQSRKILVINGPNLNNLGYRDSNLYGSLTLAQIEKDTEKKLRQWNAWEFEQTWIQSSLEGEIVDLLIDQGKDPLVVGCIINPGAYAHTSLAIADALSDFPKIKVEVHLSQLYKRDSIRQRLLTAKACDFCMTGAGELSYALATLYVNQQCLR